MKVSWGMKTFVRLMSQANVFFYRLSGGAMGGDFKGAPILLLTTTGRKSGRPYTCPLLYLKDGDSLVIVASFGGSDKDPIWWLNLKANPKAVVQVKRDVIPVTAEQAGAEDKKRLWPLFVKMWPDYAEYQKKTERDIPLAILRPNKA